MIYMRAIILYIYISNKKCKTVYWKDDRTYSKTFAFTSLLLEDSTKSTKLSTIKRMKSNAQNWFISMTKKIWKHLRRKFNSSK